MPKKAASIIRKATGAKKPKPKKGYKTKSA